MLRRWMLVLLGCAALVVGVSSCDDDEDTTGPGTQPLISQISATPAIVDAGGQVALAVSASGTGLTYLWTATGGTFSDHATAATTWTAPSAPGVYQITVTVAASNNLTASASKAIGVEITLQLNAAATTVSIARQTRIAALAVGEDLTYNWSATSGTLRQVTADTVMWRAPDTVPPQLPRVTVVVTDGAGDARTKSIELQVVPYTPADTPAYKGAAYCGECHTGTYESWAGTAHPGAYGTLAAIGMAENGYCLGCHTVGSVGVGADPERDNGGYDDVPIAALRGVQCENCHGPGGDHTGTMPTLPAPLDAANCGACHNGIHHPTYDEYRDSGHAYASGLEDGSVPTNRSCARCHNGVYAQAYLDNPATTPTVPSTITEVADITCAVCHDPHGTANIADLRAGAATDIALPNGRVVAEAGAGRLCIVCHNGRRTPTNINDQINNGTEHFGPHHSCQGDMLSGTGAYEGVNSSFTWGSSTHLQIQDGCVNCHTHAHSGDPEGGGEPNYTGHSFAPTVEACAQCHGPVEDFDQIGAMADFDGDGGVEGLQLEIEGLIEILHETILNASDTPEHRQSLVDDYETNIGLATVTTVDQRKAAYNLAFVEFDGSTGVHNAKYAVQLLQQSILFLAQPTKAVRRWQLLVD